MLGNGRLEAKCQDGETRLGQIRGQMRKKVCYSHRLLGRRVVQPLGCHFHGRQALGEVCGWKDGSGVQEGLVFFLYS
jgi:hypothetical protein